MKFFYTSMIFSIKMYLETLCMLLTVGHFAVFGTNICVSQDSCRCVKDGGRVIDLSPIGLPGYPRFYEIAAENDTDTGRYSYNPCYAFDSPDMMTTVNQTNVACRGAAACIKSPGGDDGALPEEHAIGIQNTAEFGYNGNLCLHINYTVPDSEANLTVKLVCGNTTTGHHLSIISHNFTDVVYLMQLTSKCACNNGCVSEKSDDDSGLSTGSVLLIVFFTILLSYFVVGVVWNFCNGSQGVELIPNLEFWNDLPKLIIEGVIFTCSCFGRRTSYGEV